MAMSLQPLPARKPKPGMKRHNWMSDSRTKSHFSSDMSDCPTLSCTGRQCARPKRPTVRLSDMSNNTSPCKLRALIGCPASLNPAFDSSCGVDATDRGGVTRLISGRLIDLAMKRMKLRFRPEGDTHQSPEIGTVARPLPRSTSPVGRLSRKLALR